MIKGGGRAGPGPRFARGEVFSLVQTISREPFRPPFRFLSGQGGGGAPGPRCATIDITALGQTRTRPPAAAASTGGVKRPQGGGAQAPAAPPPKVRRASAPVTLAAPVAAPVSAPVSAPVAATRPREYARVKICGRDYTMLAWFLGKFAGEKVRHGVADKFGARAVEFRQGDHKTLAKAGYAKTQRPKELLPGRTNLSADWLDTACKAVRPPNAPFQVRRGCSGRNVLWLVDDLVAHFKS